NCLPGRAHAEATAWLDQNLCRRWMEQCSALLQFPQRSGHQRIEARQSGSSAHQSPRVSGALRPARLGQYFALMLQQPILPNVADVPYLSFATDALGQNRPRYGALTLPRVQKNVCDLAIERAFLR